MNGSGSVESFILVINSGSSSLKFALYHSLNMHRQWSGQITGIATPHGLMELTDSHQRVHLCDEAIYRNQEDAALAIISWISNNHKFCEIAGIGYRIVQGGKYHRKPELITDALLSELAELIYLAPDHLPDELRLIRKFREEFPKTPHFACFDTFFHQDMPEHIKNYPLPEKFRNQGLVRYGFHGLSYEYVLQKLDKECSGIHQKKMIIAHLGIGSSMTSVSDCKGFDTTMGISPLGGMMMSTRSGDLDPGAILFILKNNDITVEELEVILSRQSGLKAISGIADLQEIIKYAGEDAKSKLALDMFCYQAVKSIGALAAGMGGLDMLIFTGGIGEHSSLIREQICTGLAFMGIRLDRSLNHQSNRIISHRDSGVNVRIIPTNEEWMIASHTKNLLQTQNLSCRKSQKKL
ncbi:acetate/propionate family kinase [Pedobacter petrophilus]|uniref:Acetate kinase n=1 Tax=Pedobacter petrophilus TaxID=1908241 RepID=A0A7K0G1V8_9SPHI|nr:acetate/propionate family kinase [Pedobacter petrophilus]MRX77813.1 acetate/propionate family kinase [Pedobacter petrophilus]